MKITKEAIAGTLESSDVMVRIAPIDGDRIELEVNSSVTKQFGDVIKQTVLETLVKLNVTSAQVIIDDKGALDCVLRARLQAAILRAADSTSVSWSSL